MLTRWTWFVAALLLTGCDSTPGSGADASVLLPDAGPDAGADPGRAVDVRFRGVGEALSVVPLYGFGGGPYPGAGTSSWKIDGRVFGAGFFASDFLLWWGFTYPGASAYETRVYAAGLNCVDAFNDDVQAGDAILGLGGDPSGTAGTCTLLGVHAVDGGVYDGWVSGPTVGSQAVDFVNRDEATRQFVITGLSEIDAGVYGFVGVARRQGPTVEQFEARFEVTGRDGLASVADDLSDAGMIITAGTGGPSGYSLVGTRPVGSTRRLTASTMVGPGFDSIDALGELLESGFAPVAFLVRDSPDGGVESAIIGQK